MQATFLHLPVRFYVIAFLALALTACGDSDSEDTEYSYAYLQFYNASANGANIEMREVDGSSFGSAQFGDATTLFSLEEGDIELEFVRTDADDQEVLIDTLTVTINEGEKTLMVLSGDFDAPSITRYSFKREELDEHFRLFTVGLMTQETYFDVYMSESGDPFEAAEFVGTADNASLTEMVFWDGDSDSDDFDSDEYTLYLTEPGATDVVFESQTIDFLYDTEYVLAVRDISGAIKNGMTVDMVLNSTSVTAITDVDAASQYRVYNATSAPLTITLGGNTDEEDQQFTLAPDSLSEFTAIRYGDYRISAESEDASIGALNNKLVTLNQSESKAILLYQTSDALNAATFIESSLPQTYDKTVNFINLSPDIDDLDVYMVRNDETIDTAQYSVQNLSPAESTSDILPPDYYEVIAVYEDDNGEQTLLDRTPLIGFNEEQNYIVTLEPANTPTGYEIAILH
ncbi:DUF4397 domain-containing protein [Alteromonas halophila]|uniref:DUF4397 domain-containing protein n=1 Tax=Alteromonas halophila TaxID=516698 RepID=A0A918JJG1_9ALTE|nr:DUF4397 domain-containing protein [Alteromonas halophila]GGW82546.1 hypothetical protein GCM10007391_14530 [Alteromonas halophila]